MTIAQSDLDSRPLRFVVLDDEDLAVVSAHLQDATLSFDDIAYLPRSARFVAVASRVDWSRLLAGQQARRDVGFHFDRVLRARRIGFDQPTTEPLQLLALSFQQTDGPAGEVLLTFAGGRAVRLDVECLDAEMRDLGPWRQVNDCRWHHLDAADASR